MAVQHAPAQHAQCLQQRPAAGRQAQSARVQEAGNQQLGSSLELKRQRAGPAAVAAAAAPMLPARHHETCLCLVRVSFLYNRGVKDLTCFIPRFRPQLCLTCRASWQPHLNALHAACGPSHATCNAVCHARSFGKWQPRECRELQQNGAVACRGADYLQWLRERSTTAKHVLHPKGLQPEAATGQNAGPRPEGRCLHAPEGRVGCMAQSRQNRGPGSRRTEEGELWRYNKPLRRKDLQRASTGSEGAWGAHCNVQDVRRWKGYRARPVEED